MNQNNQNNKNNHNHPPFRYFHNPHSYLAGYIAEGRECDICHNKLPGYKIGGLYGYEDVCESINFICEKCLVGGKLKGISCQIMSIERKGGSYSKNEYDDLKDSLKEFHPELLDDEIKKIADQRTDEINYCTPKISTWQEFQWPVHCGDYCCFIGEMGKEELNNLSLDGNGRKFLDTILFENEGYKVKGWEGEYELDNLWMRQLQEHTPRNDKDPVSCLFLFQCLTCGKYLGFTDFD